jgi:hypothetical protein
MSNPTSYGSVDDDAADRSFDVSETYYLKESQLTPGEKRKKCIAMLLPILLAIVIMGGAAALLLKDFAHLYPTSTVDRDYDGSGEHRGVPVPPAPSIPSTPTTTASGSQQADCKNNDKCHELGLVGQCCPTLAGDFLNCCH